MYEPVCGLLAEQAEVDLKYSLEQTHIGALVESNLMFPQVDKEHLG